AAARRPPGRARGRAPRAALRSAARPPGPLDAGALGRARPPGRRAGRRGAEWDRRSDRPALGVPLAPGRAGRPARPRRRARLPVPARAGTSPRRAGLRPDRAGRAPAVTVERARAAVALADWLESTRGSEGDGG